MKGLTAEPTRLGVVENPLRDPTPARSAEPAVRVRLSVIVACFNYRDFVARAIESVLRQNHGGCELIVVDDGSTDDSWDIIRSYGIPKAFRVANGGALRACRHALARSEAPFVLFLDADDELAPGSLAAILSRLDGGVAKLQFALTPIDAAGRVLGAPFPALADAREAASLRRKVLATGLYPTPPTSGNVFRRDLCDLLAEVDYETSVDGVTLFAAPFLGDVVSVSAPLGRYRLHARNFSQAGSRPTAGRFQAEAERFLLRHDHLRRFLAARGLGGPLADGTTVFFYRERRLYQGILEGRRPRLREVAALLRLLVAEGGPARRRLSMGAVLGLAYLLPRHRRSVLLAYRIGLRHRSAWGLVKEVLAPGLLGLRRGFEPHGPRPTGQSEPGPRENTWT